MQRRLRNGDQLVQTRCVRQHDVLDPLEECQLPVLRGLAVRRVSPRRRQTSPGRRRQTCPGPPAAAPSRPRRSTSTGPFVGRELVGELKAPEHPADRRPRVRLLRRIDGAGDDQPLLRPRHRDVVEAQPLRVLLGAPRFADGVPVAGAAPLAAHRMRDPEAEATVGEAEDLVGRGRRAVPARVGDDDDLELEPLRGVNREQPHRARALLLRHGLPLRRADRLLLAHEADEALDVRAAQLLVGAGEPRQLAQVRVAAAAVPLGEHGEVVVVLGDDPLAQALERQPARRGREPVVALLERAHEPLVRGREARRRLPLEAGEDRPLRRRPADQHESVVRDADEAARRAP